MEIFCGYLRSAHTFSTHLLLYKDGTPQKLHQLLKAVERSGLSLVDGALALVTHPFDALTPVLPFRATWFLRPPTPLPQPPGPLPSQSTKENPHARLLLASAPLVPPLCLCPSLFCSPPSHPKGTHYPSPLLPPRLCSSICLSSFQWPVTSFRFPPDCSWIIHAPNSPFVLLFFFPARFYLHSWCVQTLPVLICRFSVFTAPSGVLTTSTSQLCPAHFRSYVVKFAFSLSLNVCHQIIFSDVQHFPECFLKIPRQPV